jgi:hypothetical protein
VTIRKPARSSNATARSSAFLPVPGREERGVT